MAQQRKALAAKPELDPWSHMVGGENQFLQLFSQCDFYTLSVTHKHLPMYTHKSSEPRLETLSQTHTERFVS